MDQSKRQLWQFPWRYKEGFILTTGLWIVGLLIESLSGHRSIRFPGWPFHIEMGFGITVLLIIIHLLYKDSALIKWLSSVPASISSIVLFTILLLAMGLIPQQSVKSNGTIHILGLDRIHNSWPFLLSTIMLFTSLSFTILKRFKPPFKKNIFFLLNHLGLWLIIFAVSVGASDTKDLFMQLEKNTTTIVGTDDQNQTYKMPFQMKLLDFSIQLFPPKIALFDNYTGKINVKDKRNLFLIKKNASEKILDWTIAIKEFIPSVKEDSSGYYASNDTGSAPAAFVTVYQNEKQITKGWITSGGLKVKPKYLEIDNNYSIAMTIPEPERYSSKIVYTIDKHHYDTTSIEVNNPLKIGSWKIYQMSYDKEKGQWSTISIMEAIQDPWLPIIYAGIFMLFGVASYLFWIGKN